MEKLLINEFFNYRFLSNLKSSPKKDKFAMVVSKVNEEANRYDQNLWIYDGGLKQLTSGNQEASYIWESNEQLLFKAMRNDETKKAVEEGEERSSFYRIHLAGGEAQLAFTLPLNITRFEVLNEDQYIMVVDYDLLHSKMYLMKDEEKQALLKQRKLDKAVEVVDELPFYANGGGYINKHRSRLMLYTVSTQTIEFLVDEEFDTDGFTLSEDKKKMLYWGVSFHVTPQRKAGIFEYDFESKKTEQLLPSGVAQIDQASYLKDQILVVASYAENFGINENSQFYLLAKQTLTLLAKYEQAIGNSVGSDCRYGGGSSVVVSEDKCFFITTIRNSSHLYSLDLSGRIEEVFTPEGSVDAIAMSDSGLIAIAMLDNHLQEVYEVDSKKQLTHFNDDVLQGKYVADYEAIHFINDGVELDGWVLKPINYDPAKRYPAILDIHGGPKTVYGQVFYHEMQYWASCGYFVFFMNPRGSDGRGNEFADIRGKYGTIDYEDLMRFCDVVLETYPAIDKTRVGETGGSYGGFMSNWINGHTDRFAAIASQRSISNWLGFSFTSDIGPYFADDQCGSNLWQDPEKLWWHSPLKYAQSCKTPMLFIHSDEDYRCPLSEGVQMASALMNQGVPTRLVMFKGENHELSRSGKPLNRIRRLSEITTWMDTYCKGANNE